MAESSGWVHTARRILRDPFRLLGEIVPTFELDGIEALDDAFLERHGIRALIWDVDGTLTAHHASELAPEVRAPFHALRGRPDLRHAIVSNCSVDRFRELGGLFPDMPVLLGFETAEGLAFRILHAGEERLVGAGRDRLRSAEAGKGVDGDVRPLRKPSAALVHEALRVLGLEQAPEAVLMVGDQYFTDTASANLAGIKSGKVPTLHPESFPRAVRLGQRLERCVYRVVHGTGTRRARMRGAHRRGGIGAGSA
jgi:predicted HAD superfamily phosphohydrolase YqeG